MRIFIKLPSNLKEATRIIKAMPVIDRRRPIRDFMNCELTTMDNAVAGIMKKQAC